MYCVYKCIAYKSGLFSFIAKIWTGGFKRCFRRMWFETETVKEKKEHPKLTNKEKQKPMTFKK